jgi:nicotinamide phosphoribosyltransferase-like protein
MRGSVMLKTDSYKVTHWRQYPPGTTGVYSYMESRGGQWPTSVFFGLQYLLREYVVGPVVSRSGIEQARTNSSLSTSGTAPCSTARDGSMSSGCTAGAYPSGSRPCPRGRWSGTGTC